LDHIHRVPEKRECTEGDYPDDSTQQTGLEILIAADDALTFQSLCQEARNRDRLLHQTSLTRFAANRWTGETKTRLLKMADDPANPHNIR